MNESNDAYKQRKLKEMGINVNEVHGNNDNRPKGGLNGLSTNEGEKVILQKLE